MSNVPEDFDSLKRLLKLKRHEQPPPGFFNDFSGSVIARLEAAGAAGFSDEAPWLRRLLAILDTNPFAAAGFGLAACGLLVCGIVFSEYADHGSAFASGGSVTMASAGNGFAPTDFSNPQGADSETIYSTNGLGSSPFDGMNLKAQTVRFSVSQ